MKHKKVKFIKNVLISILSLLIVAIMLNMAPGYKKDSTKNKIKLIVHDENVTEDLKNDVYINQKETIYISKEDIENIFDDTIYYDEENNQIITVSDTKVANIVLGETKMTVNGSTVNLSDTIIKKDGIIYIPISEMNLIYNIDVEYIKQKDTVIVDLLDKGLIIADISKNATLRFKPRLLSKSVGEVQTGDRVKCFYTTSRGWRQIITEDGVLGYIKANKLANEYILRQDMIERKEAQKIKVNSNSYTTVYKNDVETKVAIKDILTLIESNKININSNENQDNSEVWATISNNIFEQFISNYNSRTEIINMIVDQLSKNKLNGVNIDFTQVTDYEKFKRFVIELTPRLREIGLSTALTLNNNIKKSDFVNVVDYII